MRHTLWRAKRILASGVATFSKTVRSAASNEALFRGFASPSEVYPVLVDLKPCSPVEFFSGPSDPLVSFVPSSVEASGDNGSVPLDSMGLCIHSVNCNRWSTMKELMARTSAHIILCQEHRLQA